MIQSRKNKKQQNFDFIYFPYNNYQLFSIIRALKISDITQRNCWTITEFIVYKYSKGLWWKFQLKQSNCAKMNELMNECMEYLQFDELIQNIDDKKDGDLEKIATVIKFDYQRQVFIYNPSITVFEIGREQTILNH